MKKILIYTISIFCLTIILIIGCKKYSDIFKMENNVYDIESKLKKKINEDSSKEKFLDIKVEKMLDVDNKKYVLFSHANSTCIGEAELIKGLNNKYKIKFYAYDNTLLIHFRILNEDELVIWGKNSNKRLKNLKVSIEEQNFSINAPDEEYFILSIPIQKKVNLNFPSSYTLYDKEGFDITNEFARVGM